MVLKHPMGIKESVQQTLGPATNDFPIIDTAFSSPSNPAPPLAFEVNIFHELNISTFLAKNKTASAVFIFSFQ